MPITRQHAVNQVNFLFDYVIKPYYDDPEHWAMHHEFIMTALVGSMNRGMSPAEAVEENIHIWANMLAAQSKELPWSMDLSYLIFEKGYPYLDTLNAGDLVRLVYPAYNLHEREAIIKAIENQSITNKDFFKAYLMVGQTELAPATATLLKTIEDAELASIHLPPHSLQFEGLHTAHTDFLIAIYIGTFNRAPEYDALSYWAQQLASFLATGMTEADALKAITRDIYWAGSQHGEAGTDLDDHAYIEFLYTNVLGRDSDLGGATYWQQALASGALARDELLTAFLTSALEAAGDGGYLTARIAVAAHATQVTLSNPATSLDLVQVLDGISNSVQAASSIAHLAVDGGASQNDNDAIAHDALAIDAIDFGVDISGADDTFSASDVATAAYSAHLHPASTEAAAAQHAYDDVWVS